MGKHDLVLSALMAWVFILVPVGLTIGLCVLAWRERMEKRRRKVQEFGDALRGESLGNPLFTGEKAMKQEAKSRAWTSP